MTKLQVMTLLALSAGVIGVGSTEAHAKVCPDGSVVPIYESCPRKIKAPRPIPHQASTADAFASGGGVARSGAPNRRSAEVLAAGLLDGLQAANSSEEIASTRAERSRPAGCFMVSRRDRPRHCYR